MARISGVDLPGRKHITISLRYLFGIGPKLAKEICVAAEIPENKVTDTLDENELRRIREIIEAKYKVEGDLRREVSMSVKRLMDIGCYRGIRHRKGLPVRGQRTRTNARTRKGPKRTVAGKKKPGKK